MTSYKKTIQSLFFSTFDAESLSPYSIYSWIHNDTVKEEGGGEAFYLCFFLFSVPTHMPVATKIEKKIYSLVQYSLNLNFFLLYTIYVSYLIRLFTHTINIPEFCIVNTNLYSCSIFVEKSFNTQNVSKHRKRSLFEKSYFETNAFKVWNAMTR